MEQRSTEVWAGCHTTSNTVGQQPPEVILETGDRNMDHCGMILSVSLTAVLKSQNICQIAMTYHQMTIKDHSRSWPPSKQFVQEAQRYWKGKTAVVWSSVVSFHLHRKMQSGQMRVPTRLLWLLELHPHLFCPKKNHNFILLLVIKPTSIPPGMWFSPRITLSLLQSHLLSSM